MNKRSSNEKMLIRNILGLMVYLVLGIFITYFLIGLISGSKKSIFGYTTRIVVSGSMEPEIKTNSITIIKLCDIDDIRVNDIVCFNYSQDIIHRVFEIKTNDDGDIILHTKGDANEKADDIEVYDKMVIGKVVKTFNGVSGIVNKYSISPGNIDSVALSRELISRVVIFGVAIFIIIYLISIIRILVISFSKKDKYDKIIDEYINDIDELIMYKQLVNEIKDCEYENNSATRFRFLMSRVAKARTAVEIDKLHSSIKGFKKQVKHSLWLSKLGEKIDSTDNNIK